MFEHGFYDTLNGLLPPSPPGPNFFSLYWKDSLLNFFYANRPNRFFFHHKQFEFSNSYLYECSSFMVVRNCRSIIVFHFVPSTLYLSMIIMIFLMDFCHPRPQDLIFSRFIGNILY